VNNTMTHAPASAARRAFTLAELIVVISIIVLLLAIAVPAFRNLLYSSERSLAENQMRAGITAARDAAIQSESGDAAAYFSFTPGGRLRIIPVVQVGTITDIQTSSNGSQPGGIEADRDVFVPLGTSEPVQLPRWWSVRGYTPPLTTENREAGGRHGWYENLRLRGDQGNWVFPETGFIDPADGEAGWTQQSFIIRFTGGTGELDASNRNLAIVLDVSATDEFRNAAPWSIPALRADIATNQARFARRVLAERQDLTDPNRLRILGDRSLDTVLVRPVSELGLYDERRLAAGLGATSLNRVTGTLYANDTTDPTRAALIPTLDTGLFTGVNEEEIADMINRWIEGRLTMNGELVESESRVFGLQNYLGQMQEVEP